MTKHATYTFRGSRLSAAQRQALNAISTALKRRAIDFYTASELSDTVRVGQIVEVMKRLEVARMQAELGAEEL